MYNCVELCRTLAVVGSVFFPFACNNILKMLDCKLEWNFKSLKEYKVKDVERLFDKIEDIEEIKEIVSQGVDLKEILKC